MPNLKTKAELELLDRANRVVQDVLDEVGRLAVPGTSTADLDQVAETMIRDRGGVPAFLGYHGFPATLCTSINDVVVHGIPNPSHILQEGDIIGVDCGVFLEGFCGDSARTFAVGECSPEAHELLEVTNQSLQCAVDAAVVGGRLSDIGHAVQSHVESNGCSVVKDFVGHGIGAAMHEDPQVPNYGKPGRGLKLSAGLVLAIEPMVNIGKRAVVVDDDGWTARTKDGSLSAHFEYSVAITDDGPRVLGLAPEDPRSLGYEFVSASESFGGGPLTSQSVGAMISTDHTRAALA